MEKKSRWNGQGLVVWAIFAARPRATIDKFRLLNLSAPPKLPSTLNFFFLPAFWIERSSVGHNCSIVSKGVKYWQNFGSEKKPSSSLRERGLSEQIE